MKDFLAKEHAERLQHHQLADFESLWALQLDCVDDPNVGRGGYSMVAHLSVDGHPYYLKRQTSHLAYSWRHPLGEPTLAREFRNIRLYQRLKIPAAQAAFFGQRRVGHEQRAILLTPALEGWSDLRHYLDHWSELAPTQRQHILHAVGHLARQLHQNHLLHGCFYPKHIFLRAHATHFEACLIDLEKTRRPLFWRANTAIRDLEPLIRRAQIWNGAEVDDLLSAYLEDEPAIALWKNKLVNRQRHKGHNQ